MVVYHPSRPAQFTSGGNLSQWPLTVSTTQGRWDPFRNRQLSPLHRQTRGSCNIKRLNERRRTKRDLKQEQRKVRPANTAGKIVLGVRSSTQTHLEEMWEAAKDKMVPKVEVILGFVPGWKTGQQLQVKWWICFFYNGHNSMGISIPWQRKAWCHLLFPARSVTRQQGASDHINPALMGSIAGTTSVRQAAKQSTWLSPGQNCLLFLGLQLELPKNFSCPCFRVARRGQVGLK